MLGYLLRRTVLAAVTGLAVLTLVFCIVRILPGDPAHVILGDFASAVAPSRRCDSGSASTGRCGCNTSTFMRKSR